MAAAITLTDVTIAFHGHPAVHHVSGAFEQGSLTAVVGPNGAGKSTLLSAIAGLRRTNQGHIDIGGGEGSQGNPPSIAFLRQLSGINQDFPLRVLEVVAMGAWAQVGAFGSFGHDVMHQIESALQQVGMRGFEDRLIDELSVGQLQRVLFARLIVQNAPIILLDEPFNALDASTTQDLLKIVHAWHESGRTVLAVLHDLAMVREHFPQTLLIARELVAWGPTHDALSPQCLMRANASSLVWQDTASWCAVPGQTTRLEHTHG